MKMKGNEDETVKVLQMSDFQTAIFLVYDLPFGACDVVRKRL